MRSSSAANFKNLRNFKAEYFISNFGDKVLATVNLSLVGSGKFVAR